MTDVQKLIKDSIKKDRVAQKRLYELFASRMLSICYRYTQSSEDAQDIFQEGFLKVFENLNKLKNAESIEWWMRKIFINESLKLYHHTVGQGPIENRAKPF